MKKTLLAMLCLCGCTEYFYSYSAHSFDLFTSIWFLIALAVCVYYCVKYIKVWVKQAPKWVKNIKTMCKRRKFLIEKYRNYIINCDKKGKIALGYKQWKFAYADKKTDKRFSVNKKKSILFLVGLTLFLISCTIIRCHIIKHNVLSSMFEYCMNANYTTNSTILSVDFNPKMYRVHCDNFAEEIWRKRDKWYIDTVFDK